jgi:hypothetical protein
VLREGELGHVAVLRHPGPAAALLPLHLPTNKARTIKLLRRRLVSFVWRITNVLLPPGHGKRTVFTQRTVRARTPFLTL